MITKNIQLFTTDFSIAFSIGHFVVRWYSIIIFLSFLICYISSIILGRKKKINTSPIENFIFILFPVALISARIWFVLGDINLFAHEPWINIFDIFNGGIAIEGGVIGGVIAGYFWFNHYSKKYDVSIWVYADCIMPNVLLGQAIGRWGNFFNQELLGHISYSGFPHMLPHFIKDHLHLPTESNLVVRQPLFLYESFFDFIGWSLLVIIIPKIKKMKLMDGSLFSLYFIYYGILRTILEPFRYSAYIMKIGPIPVSIILSIMFVIIGISLFIFINFKDKIKLSFKREKQ